jgi:nucleotide-binding universal stress UspA family protein
MRKIICAVDDTSDAEKAVAIASDLAKATGAELILLAVNQAIGGVGAKGGPGAFLWTDAGLNQILTKAATAAKDFGVSRIRSASSKAQDVADAIVDFALENEADHIVVGTGEKNALSRFRLGSVSRDVVFRAPCAVTVAR